MPQNNMQRLSALEQPLLPIFWFDECDLQAAGMLQNTLSVLSLSCRSRRMLEFAAKAPLLFQIGISDYFNLRRGYIILFKILNKGRRNTLLKYHGTTRR